MTTILQLNNSVFGDNGQSSQLADRYVSKRREADAGINLVRRDLAAEPVTHLTGTRFKAALTDPGERSSEQADAAAIADTLIAEIQEADEVVIAAPTYNFNVASTLKAWFDHVARAGTTFKYTEKGPVGLLANKKATVFITSGGQYADTPADFQAPYVEHFLKFLGIEDVRIVRAEGLAMGDDAANAAIESAHQAIDDLA
ncbi:FMN-dependent NADH-azoreductase [Tamilnaduibacter salinus]|uniref:FMN dependent NADH:quinone oxidoreductase n=1 Tax=Tamilnaduibacter salinus TaxID=1484056 RepID=A0A2A2I6C1_9GAMM|nr:NAD(P)H-dependent oxidoreductase [Tamilnaduibacter salinus]PAV27132.1 FMN-dependent NADH-azoreductase [Tamilnaduibacter salinus]PVY79039.1 FMN-dependent NADH-azoreductase [Tamilnaduibacter salinus]